MTTQNNGYLDRLVMTTRRSSFLQWLDEYARARVPWFFPFGLSCCSLEQSMAFPGYDLIADMSLSPQRIEPEEADMMIFGGSVNVKLLPSLLALHGRLKEPKWVMAVGACAASGGLYAESYGIAPGLSSEIPVDIYIPGCPPTPAALREGFELMRERMDKHISRWSLIREQEERV